MTWLQRYGARNDPGTSFAWIEARRQALAFAEMNFTASP